MFASDLGTLVKGMWVSHGGKLTDVVSAVPARIADINARFISHLKIERKYSQRFGEQAVNRSNQHSLLA